MASSPLSSFHHSPPQSSSSLILATPKESSSNSSNTPTTATTTTDNDGNVNNTSSNMVVMHMRSAQEFAEEHWNRAAAVLSARPSLMTPHVLLLVLKNRPPAHVVEFMLQLNPRAANIPTAGATTGGGGAAGPTALQVAVRYHASVDVVRLVIEACPMALVTTHSGQDPLMYAKIWRRDEPKLIQLLSQPLSYWEKQAKVKKELGLRTSTSNMQVSSGSCSSSSSRRRHSAMTTTTDDASDADNEPIGSFPTLSWSNDYSNHDAEGTSPRNSSSSSSNYTTTTTSRRSRAIHLPSTPSNTSKTTKTTSSCLPNSEEIDNIKTIAATIVRAQKRQVQALQHHKSQVAQSLHDYQVSNMEERLQQLDELEKQHQKHFKSQLIALDMKEKRMMARVKRMEQRVHKTLELSKRVRDVKERQHDVTLQEVERNVEMVRGSVYEFQGWTEQRLDHVELRVDQESRVNDYFRTDTRMHLDQLEQQVRSNAFDGVDVIASAATAAASARHVLPQEEEDTSRIPVVYATPYLVDEDEDDEMDTSIMPLFPKPFGTMEQQQTTATRALQNARKRYPTKRRRKRYLLGSLNF